MNYQNKVVACIGNGFVGGSLTTVLAEKNVKVFVFDKAGKLANGGCYPGVKPDSTTEFINACESYENFSGIYFVCLPTPMNEDGSADISIVESVLDELSAVPGTRLAVVKSTVPPGTTQLWNKKYSANGLRVIFNPEFLREASALDDMRNQDKIILGGPRPYINTIKEFYNSVFPNVKLIKTSSTTAEMVKYVTNVHLAVKVALANEFNQVCRSLDAEGFDIDYDKVIEYATEDKRLGTSHWSVPGPDGSPGFGGHCFPKDLNALIKVAESIGVNPTVMKASWSKNLEVRNKESRDWETMLGRAVSKKIM